MIRNEMAEFLHKWNPAIGTVAATKHGSGQSEEDSLLGHAICPCVKLRCTHPEFLVTVR